MTTSVIERKPFSGIIIIIVWQQRRVLVLRKTRDVKKKIIFFIILLSSSPDPVCPPHRYRPTGPPYPSPRSTKAAAGSANVIRTPPVHTLHTHTTQSIDPLQRLRRPRLLARAHLSPALSCCCCYYCCSCGRRRRGPMTTARRVSLRQLVMAGWGRGEGDVGDLPS